MTGERTEFAVSGRSGGGPGIVAGTAETAEELMALPAPRGGTVGLYVHVPFCARRCHYCSFNTAPLGEAEGTEAFVGALVAEIGLVGGAELNRPRVRLATVFFGGGTPSLLEPGQMAAIMAAIRERFDLAPGAEVTAECNPESATADRLAGYREAGINRVSLGVQGLDDRILGALGRLHTAAGARAAFEAARAAGFEDVSVDLMYGLPGLDAEGWRRSVVGVLDWEPDHLSAYGLTLDAGSLWGATGGPALPAEETVVTQYWALAAEAAARGYEHYEISNYARPGHRSAHNQIYWRRQEYLACGPGACGFLGDVRWSNVKPVARYRAMVEAGRLPLDAAERLSPEQALAETLILGLRTADGVPAAALAGRIATDRALAGRVARWREQGLLLAQGDRLRLSEAGFLLSDALFVALV
jgi:oxygen-independent coproporphyrinogen-3 oxidase